MWVLGIESESSVEQREFLTAEPSFQSLATGTYESLWVFLASLPHLQNKEKKPGGNQMRLIYEKYLKCNTNQYGLLGKGLTS